MEIRDTAPRLDNILLNNKAIGQIMACAWAWLQSKHKHGWDQQCCSHTLQWEHETMARHCNEPIQAPVDKVRWLWYGVCADVQLWPLDDVDGHAEGSWGPIRQCRWLRFPAVSVTNFIEFSSLPVVLRFTSNLDYLLLLLKSVLHKNRVSTQCAVRLVRKQWIVRFLANGIGRVSTC